MALDQNMAACIMKLAPMYTTVRVNTLKMNMVTAKQKMEQVLEIQYRSKGYNGPCPVVEIHKVIHDLLVIKAIGPNYNVIPLETEIYVDEPCASAVMRGADIFSCGVLGSNKKFRLEDKVSVYADLAGKCLWGNNKLYTQRKQFLGNGVTKIARDELYSSERRTLKGVGVSINAPIFLHPKLDELIDGWGFAQNLPSILCGHILNPQPGDIVLDLCAAPGGKSTHLATLMKDQGKLICIDIATNRLPLISKTAKLFSLKCIEVYRADGTNLVNENISPGAKVVRPPFPHESFDKILLDAPCSCLGARPMLRKLSPTQISSYPQLQRNLLKTAVRLLKKGGTLVYSTCTLTETENEENVEWVLNKFDDMKLVSQEPFVITDQTRLKPSLNFVQKFDPMHYCKVHEATANCLNYSDNDISNWNPYATTDLLPEFDTVGFFIAKFMKH